MMMDKKQIRKEIFKYRTLLSEEFVLESSKLIFDKIMATDWYKETKNIFLYASYNNETDTRYITECALRDDKIVCMPKVSTNVGIDNKPLCEMNFYKISSFSDFMEGYKGIPEPIDGLPCLDDFTQDSIIIIPMVAFDKNRTRVGYGKGFYDRYLGSHSFKKVIGVAFEGQRIMENITIEKNPFDISPEIIYTEKGVY